MDTFNNSSTELNDWLSLLDHMIITQRVRVGDLSEISDLIVKLKVSVVNDALFLYTFVQLQCWYMKMSSYCIKQLFLNIQCYFNFSDLDCLLYNRLLFVSKCIHCPIIAVLHIQVKTYKQTKIIQNKNNDIFG